jgi:uncharacterized DUF497 family protein
MLGMTFKAIRYSRHAAKNLKRRRISRGNVRWLIARGIRQEGRTKLGEKRWTVDGTVANRKLRVVFIERANDIEVVTVMEKW